MKTYTYSININKPINQVFETVTNKSVYPNWAKAWGEGMTYEGEWTEGEHLIFHDATGGTKALVVSVDAPNHIKLKHVAMVDAQGEEQEPSDEAMKKWIGSLEEYYFIADSDQSTKMEVVMEIDEMFEEMSQGTWPKALQLLKQICEANS